VTTETPRNVPVDVNAASGDDLIPIDGIGPVLAQRIVQYREEHGPFVNLDELTAVQGIGSALLDRIGPQITVIAATAAADVEETSVTSQAEPPQLASPIVVSEETEAEGEPSEAALEKEPKGTAGEEEVAMPEEQTRREPEIEAEEPVEEARVTEPVPAEEQPPAKPVAAAVDEEPAEAEVAEEPPEEPPAQAEEPIKEPETAEQPEAAAPSPKTRETDAGHGFWWGFLLVAGGAIIGALVMLLVLLAYSGTLSYASRNEMEALSRNLDTIYHNSEIAWERLDRLAADNADLSAKVDRVMELSGRVAELEQDAQAMHDDLAATENSIGALESDLSELRETYGTRFDEMDTTLGEQGKIIDQMESDLAEARATMETMKQRLTAYDTFFGALRDLLVDMQGLPTGEAGADEAPVPEKETSGN